MAEQKLDAEKLEIGGQVIGRGERVSVELPVADLYTHSALTMPVRVVRGKRPGPVMCLSAAIHGDELNGVEIIRRVLKSNILNNLRGTVIAVPIINVHGFLRHSRYLPDRRDLNRCFPGSADGSVAARLAHLFSEEILRKSDFVIDLHTGAINRPNLPQIRADLDNPEVRRLAESFGCPLMVNANLREGSMREYAFRLGIPLLLYEAGEALRFDEVSIRAGVRGITGVLRELGMLPLRGKRKPPTTPVIAIDSNWVRAPESGILRAAVGLGRRVEKDEVLAIVADPFGMQEVEVRAQQPGIVIGRSNLPLTHAGDALYHVARVRSAAAVAGHVEAFQSEHEPDTGEPSESDEPPIV